MSETLGENKKTPDGFVKTFANYLEWILNCDKEEGSDMEVPKNARLEW